MFINFINGGKRGHHGGMKPFLWIALMMLAMAGLAAATVPPLQAQQRKVARARAVQLPEAPALLAREWARAHALPGH